MISLSTSQPQEEAEFQTENPNKTQDDENHNNQQKQQSQPESPETQSLETLDPQNPKQSGVDQAQNLQQEEQEGLQVLDQEGDQHHHQEPEVPPEQSGMSILSPPPTLIAPITDPPKPNPPPLTSPSNPPRRPNKRKKCVNKKKQQAMEKKIQTVTRNLKPIPFVPSKTLDFDKHEKLLKRLGLWDFVHIEFDRSIRVDLIAQLIANYDSRSRSSYVNEFRIVVNRAELARAFNLPKLPVKKDKGNALALSTEAVDLDSEALSEESIAFIEDFMSNWVLLHEDTWMMPSEVLNWRRVIKDGHPEKVDWAGLIWFMVEKELMQGQQLEFCYYASHLHYLIKSKREELFWEEPKVEVEAEAEAKEEEDGDEVKMGGSDDFQGQESDDNVLVEEPNVELTLGQETGEKEEVKDGDIMDTEESKEEEEGHWLLDGKNMMGDHLLQHCSVEDGRDMDDDEEKKPEEEEEEEENDGEEEEPNDDGFNLTLKGHTLERDGFTGNLLQGMETTQIPFSLPGQLCDQSNMDLLASRTEPHKNSGGQSMFGNGGKREIYHEHDILHDSLNSSNKRLRSDGPWDHKSSDFETCMEQLQHWMGKARVMYEAKEQVTEESSMNQQFLLSELQRRDNMIEHLHKTKCEELQKKDVEIYRLERELYLMGNLLDGYRKALKETHKAFSEYRQLWKLHEEPLYKDAGPGGVILSTTELEKQHLKREEEDRLNRIIIVQKTKDFEQECVGKLEAHFNEVYKLDKRLMDFENQVKLVKELSAKRKISGTSERVAN